MKLRRISLAKAAAPLAVVALGFSILGAGTFPLVPGFAALGLLIYWVRRRRPSTLRFWDDGSGRKLTVRRLPLSRAPEVFAGTNDQFVPGPR